MQKYYSTIDFKQRQLRRFRRLERRIIKKRIIINSKKRTRTRNRHRFRIQGNLKDRIAAPLDFRLIENTEDCLDFFRKLRNPENWITSKHTPVVRITLTFVQFIDYATISVLTAIGEELKFKNVILEGDFPKNLECKQFMIDSGILDHMVDKWNRKFKKSNKATMIFFEKGTGRLSDIENRKISELIKEVMKHLTGEAVYNLPMKTVLLEICGNAIEHGLSELNQWLLGVKFEPNKVVFTVTDVGRGILETLRRKYGQVIRDVFLLQDNLSILKGAFTKKYMSRTLEPNRNKGLPAIKSNSDSQNISKLLVLTNNVILHFENERLSRTFRKGAPRFRGTIYQWEFTKDNI